MANNKGLKIEEREHQKSIDHMYKIIIFLIMIFILIPSVITQGSDINKVAKNIKVYQLKYNLEKDAYKIDVSIPVIKGINNRIAQNEFNQEIRDGILNFTEEIKIQAEEFMEDANQQNFPFHQYQALVTIDVKNEVDILSFAVKYYQYTGGAHGMTTVVSYNLNTKTGMDLSLEEYLTRTNMNLEQVRKMIEDEIKDNPHDYFSDAIETIRNKTQFSYYIDDDNLIVFFQTYEIAPYVAGIPGFKLELEKNN